MSGWRGNQARTYDFARSDGEGRARVEAPCRFLELGQQQECEQERANNVGGDGALIPLGEAEGSSRDARILADHVDAIELPVDARRELPNALVAREVKLPDGHGRRRAAQGPVNRLLRRLALLRVPDREDDAGGTQTTKVTSRFEAEANVGAGDDDGLIVKAGPRHRRGDEELAVEKATEHGIWDEHHAFECRREGVGVCGCGFESSQLLWGQNPFSKKRNFTNFFIQYKKQPPPLCVFCSTGRNFPI